MKNTNKIIFLLVKKMQFLLLIENLFPKLHIKNFGIKIAPLAPTYAMLTLCGS